MKIVICDDDLKDIETIRNHILAHKKTHEIIEFTSAVPLLECLYDGEHFDLLFLDLQMPDSDGWEVAKELKQAKIKTFIAMVTVMGERIYECFDRVDWFTPKPVPIKMAHQIIDNAYEKLYPKVFDFQTDIISVSLTAPEIIYAEVMHNNLYIHTTTGGHKIRFTMHELTDMLSESNCFAQIHQSFIINLSYFERVDGNDIIIKSGAKLPLSRNNKKMFFTALARYIRGN